MTSAVHLSRPIESTRPFAVSNVLTDAIAPAASPDGRLLAIFRAPKIVEIESLESQVDECLHTFNLDLGSSIKSARFRWCPHDPNIAHTARLLLYDDQHVQLYQVEPALKKLALIDNGTASMGKITSAEFGDSRSVLVFSDFNARILVFFLDSGRSLEIKDPKGGPYGHGFRTPGGVLALLCRSGAKDRVELRAPRTFGLIKSVELSTVDAQGVKWSPDGQWFAVWETMSMGIGVHVHTAEGHMYRSYTGKDAGDGVDGVRTIEWSADGRWLALGCLAQRVILLNARTFSPHAFLKNTTSIEIPDGIVYEEQVTASHLRQYKIITGSVTPPAATVTSNDILPKQGISLLSFNADGTMLVTKDDSLPTTLCLWSLDPLRLHTVLIQHSAIKAVHWHPHDASILAIQCANAEPLFYLYDIRTGSCPAIVQLPDSQGTNSRRQEFSWVDSASKRKMAVWNVGRDGAYVVRLRGADEGEMGEGQEYASPQQTGLGGESREGLTASGDEEEDSLMEALSPRKLRKR